MGFETLEYLLKNHRKKIVAAYTLDKSLAKKTAYFFSFQKLKKYGMPIRAVKDINHSKVITQIVSQKPDLIITVAWSQIFSKEILKIPQLGCIGFHSSLLPKYSGGSPVNWGIINGEKQWGITLFYLTSSLDEGNIIAQEKFRIDLKDTCKTTYDKATLKAVRLLKKYLPQIIKGTAPRIKQNLSQATRFKRRKPEDGLINWSKTKMQLYNWVRALTHPYPGAFTFFNGRKMHIWTAELTESPSSYSPGKVIRLAKRGLIVSAKNGSVLIKKLQMDGDNEINASYAAEKYKIRVGDKFNNE